mgnify:CR=1 FL=1
MMSPAVMPERNIGLSSHYQKNSIFLNFFRQRQLNQNPLRPSRLVTSLCIRSIATRPLIIYWRPSWALKVRASRGVWGNAPPPTEDFGLLQAKIRYLIPAFWIVFQFSVSKFLPSRWLGWLIASYAPCYCYQSGANPLENPLLDTISFGIRTPITWFSFHWYNYIKNVQMVKHTKL